MESCLTPSDGNPCARAQRTQYLPKFGKPTSKLDCTLTLSERYHIDSNHLVFYWILCWHRCSERYHFWIKFDNLLFRSFHTFGCKQTVTKMITDSSAFTTLGDPHGEYSVMVAIDGSTVHGTPFNSFLNGSHPIGSISYAFGWPYVGFGWKAIPLRIIILPMWIITIVWRYRRYKGS